MAAKLILFPNRKKKLTFASLTLAFVVIVVALVQENHESVIQSLCIILKQHQILKGSKHTLFEHYLSLAGAAYITTNEALFPSQNKELSLSKH